MEIILFTKKSCRWEPSTLLACADSSTNNMKSCLFLFIYLTLLGTFHIFCCFFWHFKKNNVSPITCHVMSYVICKVSHVTCHISHVTCHLPPVTFHLPPGTNADSHEPSPADSPIIHSRLVPFPKKNLINHGPKTVITFEPSMQFWCPPRFRVILVDLVQGQFSYQIL